MAALDDANVALAGAMTGTVAAGTCLPVASVVLDGTAKPVIRLAFGAGAIAGAIGAMAGTMAGSRPAAGVRLSSVGLAFAIAAAFPELAPLSWGSGGALLASPISGVTAKAQITFVGVEPNATKITLLRLQYDVGEDNNLEIKFRNVPLIVSK